MQKAYKDPALRVPTREGNPGHSKSEGNKQNDETECGLGREENIFGQGVRKGLSKEVTVKLGHKG